MIRSFLTGDTEIYLDIRAIDEYFARTQPATMKARLLKESWIKWYHSLSEWEKRTDTDVLMQARGRRNDFSIANATTPEALEHVNEVLERGKAETGTIPEVSYFWNSGFGQTVKQAGWFAAIGTGALALGYAAIKLGGAIIKLNPAVRLLK